MHRAASCFFVLALCLTAVEGAQAQVPKSGRDTSVPVMQDRLDAELRDFETRLGAGGLAAEQAVSDSERLRARYLTMRPLAPAFGADEFRRQGRLAERSFAWLDGTRRRFRGNALVARSLLGTYAALGDFYGRGSLGSRAGFWFGYAGAHRAGRSLLLGGQGGRDFERQLEQLAISWAAVGAMGWPQNRWLWSDWGAAAPGYERFIDQAVGREAMPGPMALPSVDDAALSEADRATWREVRDRFPSVAARAHQAQLALADLGRRLAQRGMDLHATSVAASLAMQGYLQDTVDAVEAREFARAIEALTRADYERNKLRNATGQ